jgi:hypothetical protein
MQPSQPVHARRHVLDRAREATCFWSQVAISAPGHRTLADASECTGAFRGHSEAVPLQRHVFFGTLEAFSVRHRPE